jgi:hypothetical protein
MSTIRTPEGVPLETLLSLASDSVLDDSLLLCALLLCAIMVQFVHHEDVPPLVATLSWLLTSVSFVRNGPLCDTWDEEL